MREVSISQLWGRTWDLFKVNWLLLVGLSVLYVIVSFIPFIGGLIAWLLPLPAFVRAGYLVALKGQSSFGEAFRDISLLLKVFVYYLILGLIPGSLIGFGYILVLDSAGAGLSEAYTENGYGGMSGSMVSTETGGILVVAGLIILFILNLFGWAGPYAILSGRAGIFSAIGQSFSLTAQNFGKVFVAFLSFIGLVILGAMIGLLVVIPVLAYVAYVSWPIKSLSLIGLAILGLLVVISMVAYVFWPIKPLSYIDLAMLGALLCGVGLLVVVPVGYVFLPLLYMALTDEEGVSHAKSLRLG